MEDFQTLIYIAFLILWGIISATRKKKKPNKPAPGQPRPQANTNTPTEAAPKKGFERWIEELENAIEEEENKQPRPKPGSQSGQQATASRRESMQQSFDRDRDRIELERKREEVRAQKAAEERRRKQEEEEKSRLEDEERQRRLDRATREAEDTHTHLTTVSGRRKLDDMVEIEEGAEKPKRIEVVNTDNDHTEDADAKPQYGSAARIKKMLQNKDSVRDAVIVSEILKRPYE